MVHRLGMRIYRFQVTRFSVWGAYQTLSLALELQKSALSSTGLGWRYRALYFFPMFLERHSGDQFRERCHLQSLGPLRFTHSQAGSVDPSRPHSKRCQQERGQATQQRVQDRSKTTQQALYIR